VGSLADHDIVLIRADNPTPLTLTGTNTWFVSGWVIDPGPALDAHLDAVAAAGDVEGIAITHDHEDHVEGLDGLLRRVGDVPVVSARREHTGPLEVVPLPGHSDDSVAFVAGRAAFVGDAVLGEGSVFVTGQLAAYLDGLRELRKRDLAVLCPGHGPPIWDVRGKLDEYIAHRLDREERLLAALDRGLRSEDELLDAAWDDAPEELRPFAAVSLRAHLEKLRAEGRA
jgi:glyoxylase-like metal-dependent hydrolase (beta-lactamase superfamily II)